MKSYSKKDRRFLALCYCFTLFFAIYWGSQIVQAAGLDIYFAPTALGGNTGITGVIAFKTTSGSSAVANPSVFVVH
jgi:hypothetical protein